MKADRMNGWKRPGLASRKCKCLTTEHGGRDCGCQELESINVAQRPGRLGRLGGGLTFLVSSL